jgi:hypothetical protein
MAETLSNLFEDLTSAYPNGSPVIVIVNDYRSRQQLVDDMVDEARIFGVELVVSPRLEDAMARLPILSAQRDQAALLLIDADAAEPFGPWLDAAREALPNWVRFLLLLVLPQDIPALARTAPAFMSWAKGLEFRHLDVPAVLPQEDVQAELARIEHETGMTPAEYVEAWREGTLPDNFRHTTWLSLAWAASGDDRNGPA